MWMYTELLMLLINVSGYIYIYQRIKTDLVSLYFGLSISKGKNGISSTHVQKCLNTQCVYNNHKNIILSFIINLKKLSIILIIILTIYSCTVLQFYYLQAFYFNFSLKFIYTIYVVFYYLILLHDLLLKRGFFNELININ